MEEILAKATHEITTAQNEAATRKIVPGSRSYSDTYTITWWAPFSGWGMNGLACWKNVAFNYTYDWYSDHWQFESVSNINSYVTGLQVAVSWCQTAASWNPATTEYYHDTANIEVHGYWLLGFDIHGFTIGAKINDEWNCSLQLVTE